MKKRERKNIYTKEGRIKRKEKRENDIEVKVVRKPERKQKKNFFTDAEKLFSFF